MSAIEEDRDQDRADVASTARDQDSRISCLDPSPLVARERSALHAEWNGIEIAHTTFALDISMRRGWHSILLRCSS